MIGAIVVGDGVGTGIAGVVPGTMGDAGNATSTDAARSVLTHDAGIDPTVFWGIAAVLILVGWVERSRSRPEAGGGEP